MTYGLSNGLFVENGPAVRSAETRARRSTADAWFAWKALDEERRLELVASELKAAA